MIRTRRDVWLAAAAITVIANIVVVATLMLVYPPSVWLFNLSVSAALTTVLSFVFTLLVAQQSRRNYELAWELGRLLDRDRLTDVATRDFFYQKMAEAPGAYGLSLMIDIDHFKAVNDTYGHSAGDAVIRHVAQILRDNCRSDDIVCRFGGEEFVVFLFGVEKTNGLAVAERMRKIIAAAPARHDEIDLAVTVSIGGSLKECATEIESCIREADTALYRAKELGRNRSIMSWLAPPERGHGAAA